MESTPLLDLDDTAGAFTLVEHRLEDHHDSYLHEDEDTWIYVLDGEIEVELGDDAVGAKKDDLVTVPRGARHAVRAEGARVLAVRSPAGDAPWLPDRAPLLRADEGERTKLGPMGVRFMIDAETTGGRFSLVEHPIDPLGLAAPVHTHGREDEWSYVLYGLLGAELEGRAVQAGPGELVRKGRGPHAFWNAVDGPTSLLEFIAPGGFERYFAEIAPLLRTAPDPEKIGAMMARYDLSMDLASAERLVREHGLAGAREDLGPR